MTIGRRAARTRSRPASTPYERPNRIGLGRERKCRAHAVAQTQARRQAPSVTRQHLDSRPQASGCQNPVVRVVVSGASGLIGSALVPALRADGHDVVRLVRREPAGADEIRWNPAAGELDAARLEGIDAIVNLSGANIGQRWTDARQAEILDVARCDHRACWPETAAALDPRPSVFVCASAIGAYGDRGDEILTEESELGSGFVADVVRAWEAAADPRARAAFASSICVRASSWPTTVARSSGCSCRSSSASAAASGAASSGSAGSGWTTSSAHYRRALSTDLSGPVNVTAPNPVTNAQFTKALGSALSRPTILPVPGFAIRTLFGEMGDEMLPRASASSPAKLLDAGFEFAAPTIDVGLGAGSRRIDQSGTMARCSTLQRSAGTTAGTPRSSRIARMGSCQAASPFSTAANTTS